MSDHDLDPTADPDPSPSAEQTMGGIRSFKGWLHIPDMDTTASTSDDNPFAGPKLQPSRKVSVSMPTDEWLRQKLNKLVEGYASCESEVYSTTESSFNLISKVSE